MWVCLCHMGAKLSKVTDCASQAFVDEKILSMFLPIL